MAVQQGHSSHTDGPSSLAHAWVKQLWFIIGLLNERPLLPPAVWPQGILSHKSGNTISDIVDSDVELKAHVWIAPQRHIAQIRTYIICIYFQLLFDSSPSAIGVFAHFIPSFKSLAPWVRQDTGSNKPSFIHATTPIAMPAQQRPKHIDSEQLHAKNTYAQVLLGTKTQQLVTYHTLRSLCYP